MLEEPTELELSGEGSLDPVDLEIFLHKLDSIIDDGRDVCKYLSMAEMLQAATWAWASSPPGETWPACPPG